MNPLASRGPSLDARLRAAQPGPDGTVGAQVRSEDLRALVAAKDRFIEQLQQQLRDVLDGAPSRQDMAALQHQLGEIRADRDRLEAVNDQLRKRLEAKRALVADLRGQLHPQQPTAAELTGIPDDLLVPWVQGASAAHTPDA